MILADKIRAKVDKAVTEPVRNTAVLAILAVIISVIALVISAVR